MAFQKPKAIQIWKEGESSLNFYATFEDFLSILPKELVDAYKLNDIDKALSYFVIGASDDHDHIVLNDAFEWALKRLTPNSKPWNQLVWHLRSNGAYVSIDGQIVCDQYAQLKFDIKYQLDIHEVTGMQAVQVLAQLIQELSI